VLARALPQFLFVYLGKASYPLASLPRLYYSTESTVFQIREHLVEELHAEVIRAQRIIDEELVM
jgi:hypothetical protein